MLVICRRLEIGRHLLISYSELFLWDTLGLISSNFHAYLVLAIHTNEFASKGEKISVKLVVEFFVGPVCYITWIFYINFLYHLSLDKEIRFENVPHFELFKKSFFIKTLHMKCVVLTLEINILWLDWKISYISSI